MTKKLASCIEVESYFLEREEQQNNNDKHNLYLTEEEAETLVGVRRKRHTPIYSSLIGDEYMY
ncbi:MAG: hypothetical protein K0R54_587 [Clostridiaceae bacterium]|nr:hypothetical protein [Clostridiaceae bacterium]